MGARLVPGNIPSITGLGVIVKEVNIFSSIDTCSNTLLLSCIQIVLGMLNTTIQYRYMYRSRKISCSLDCYCIKCDSVLRSFIFRIRIAFRNLVLLMIADVMVSMKKLQYMIT
jgi:hypothetical protein